MTDVASTQPAAAGLRSELRGWCEAWKECLQNVVTQVAGQPRIFELSSEMLTAADSDTWYLVVASGSVHGEMALRVPAASGTFLAQKLLGEAPASASNVPGDAAISREHKEALEELLRQVAGLAATALAATVSGEVLLRLASSGAPSWSSDAVACLRGRAESDVAVALELKISPALAAELQSRAQAASAVSPQTRSTELTPAFDANYRRLMNVGLDVKLRFGTRRMLLRDVLALSAGVVVELESALHSPVELLLDGRLIAQGEVVIVDGKYGLRVTEVVEATLAAGGLA